MALEKALYCEWVLPVLCISLMGAVVVALIVKAFGMYTRFRFYQRIPGIEDFSLIYGNLHVFPKTPDEILQFGLKQMRRFNSKYHRVWIGPLTPIIVAYHPDTVKKILQSSAPKSRGFGCAYELAVPWIGEGLISTNGDRWARSRKLITPAFHFDILKSYIQVFNEGANKLFEKLDKYAETGESFNICPLITLCTLEVILKCSLGYEADIQDSGHPYAKAVAELSQIWNGRARKPWMWPDWIFRRSSSGKIFYKHADYVHKLAEDVIEKRKQTLEKENVPKKRRLDFIDLLLTARDEDGQPMTSLEIRNEVDTFMFAGHDTTASSIPWNLFVLAQHPDYQERIQEEVDAIFNGRDSYDVTWEDLSEVKTLSICIKETFRLYPPVPIIQRQLNQEIKLEGQVLPVGSLVNVGIFQLHKNPAVWDEPDEFRPERFLPQNKKAMDSFAFLPFSAGSRNCIGQNFAVTEEKVILSRIFRRYKIQLAKDHELPKQEATVILRSQNGIWLTLKRR